MQVSSRVKSSSLNVCVCVFVGGGGGETARWEGAKVVSEGGPMSEMKKNKNRRKHNGWGKEAVLTESIEHNSTQPLQFQAFGRNKHVECSRFATQKQLITNLISPL